jgi:methionyl-tRNA synthetase
MGQDSDDLDPDDEEDYQIMGQDPDDVDPDDEGESYHAGEAGVDDLRSEAEKVITKFGPLFDDLNFSEALKLVWAFVARTDGYLTANAPWKRPADRSEADHAQHQARVLATAAEAIRILTVLVYPILPASAGKVWRQLGLGEIQDAAKQAFLTELAWGGLKAGTRFGEPAPLFPRAEKDAIDHMQNLEDENDRSAVEAVSTPENAETSSPKAPMSALGIEPSPTAAAPSVVSEQGHGTGSAAPQDRPTQGDNTLTQHTAAPVDLGQPVATAQVHQVPVELASSRLSTTPAAAPAGAPLHPVEHAPEPPAAAQQTQQITIDDFTKVELRVAQVLVAERVPKADKLLRLEVDLGYEKRQILAGIAQFYEPEKLIGRKIVIVANLAPRKMRGLESNGMLLAASLPDGAPVLAGFLEEVPLGARLK